MRATLASRVRSAYEAFANGYSWLLASNNKSTINKGMEKRLSMKNTEAYSLCHEKLDNPDKNWVAAPSEGARKNAQLRQKTLKVKIRCPHNERNPANAPGRAASLALLPLRKPRPSTPKPTP